MGSNRLSRKVCVVEILRAHRPRRPLVRKEPPDHLVERNEIAKPRLDDTQEVLPVLRLEALRFRRVEGSEERVGLAAASELRLMSKRRHLDPLARAADTEPYEQFDDAPGGREV